MDKNTKVNFQIQAKRVLLIDDKGQNLGEIDLNVAVTKAKQMGKDLVEVSKGKNPPVCKVMDYGKWKFDQSKKVRRKKDYPLKEIKMRPNIGEHDINYRVSNAKKFLEKGHKVKVIIRFRGREQAHILETGKILFDKFLEKLETPYKFDTNIKREGAALVAVLAKE